MNKKLIFLFVLFLLLFLSNCSNPYTVLDDTEATTGLPNDEIEDDITTDLPDEDNDTIDLPDEVDDSTNLPDEEIDNGEVITNPGEEDDTTEEVVETPENEPVILLTDEEYDLFARLVEAESGNQPFDGKVAVANVVINRVNSKLYPDNLYDVIYQKNQFSPAGSGSIDRMNPSQDTLNALDAAINGTKIVDEDVIYFWADYVHESNWVWTREIVIQIDTHIFAKNPT